MQISTTRFGTVEIEAEDILHFPAGLVGLDDCRHWVLLGDADNESVAWLQSATRADVAVAVVSPRRFAAAYKVRVSRKQLEALQLGAADKAYVLAIVGQDENCLTINLRAPVVINLDRRLGRQVITSDEQPIQYEVGSLTPLRKSA